MHAAQPGGLSGRVRGDIVINEPTIGEPSNRVSVWVVEAGDDEAVWSHGYVAREPEHSRELAVLTQQEREDPLSFAQRVTTKVARLSRSHLAPERLALVLQDDLTPPSGHHSEALSTVALHLMQSETSLTIRIAAE